MNIARITIPLALIAGGVLASFGTQDLSANLDSAREIWSDVLRDADQIGLQATRMPLNEEIDLGAKLASGLQSWRSEDPRDTAYVTAVAASMTPHVRRTAMPYRFHVVESPQVNAFALPGGQIYVLRGMMDFLESEAELAAILGHEIAHVDLRHCVERYQYQNALKKAGVEGLSLPLDVARMLVVIGYNQYQELEADDEGVRLAVQAGYDPAAAEAVFTRMDAQFGGRARPQATTPAGELGQAMEQALSDYFSIHPRTVERAKRMHAFAMKQAPSGRTFYVGKQNFATRQPRLQTAPEGEWKKY
jgi:predicted Zn-dependent protease